VRTLGIYGPVWIAYGSWKSKCGRRIFMCHKKIYINETAIYTMVINNSNAYHRRWGIN
jgi:hypothetical protein